MTVDQYYTAPSQEIFDEIKAASIEIWNGYDDTHGYASEKINSIKNLNNVGDNAWHMVAMFDNPNQFKLLRIVSKDTAKMIEDAINLR